MTTNRSRLNLGRLLLCAACLHLTAAAGVHFAGRWGLAPGAIDREGVAAFASDGRIYRLQLAELENILWQEGAAAWLRAPAPSHVKLYSLSSALFGGGAMGIEPVNLLYYLLTLTLVFALGREAFGERAGLFAALMTAALLPTYLLHTTQLLKDPLFVVLALALVLVSVKWLTTDYAPRGALVAGALGGAVAAGLWLVRDSMWPVMLFVMLLAAGLCVARQARRRALRVWNLAGVALMLGLSLSAPSLITPYYLPREYWVPAGRETAAPAAKTSVPAAPDGGADARPQGPWAPLVARIADRRSQFTIYEGAQSNLDMDVQFAGLSDVVAYLPRAALIGLCAPFPRMWLGAGGQVGSAGRLLSGGETFVMYVVQALALLALWRAPRRMPAWLLVLTALVGVTALGLVVINVGALYRMRYLFWILFIVVAAEPLARALAARAGRALSADAPGGVSVK